MSAGQERAEGGDLGTLWWFPASGEEWGLEGAWGGEAVSLLDFILVFKERNDTQRLGGRICRD